MTFVPLDLIIYKNPFKKIKLGKDRNGGYLKSDVPTNNYSLLLSGGINNFNTFEKLIFTKYRFSKVLKLFTCFK